MDQYWTTVKMESICVFFLWLISFLHDWNERFKQKVSSWLGHGVVFSCCWVFGTSLDLPLRMLAPHDQDDIWYIFFWIRNAKLNRHPKARRGLDPKLFNRIYHPHCWWLPIFFFRPSTLQFSGFWGGNKKNFPKNCRQHLASRPGFTQTLHL